MTEQLNVASLTVVNQVVGGRGVSMVVVSLDDGTFRTYDVVAALGLSSYKHVHGAIDNPARYSFFDTDGTLSIRPKEEA